MIEQEKETKNNMSRMKEKKKEPKMKKTQRTFDFFLSQSNAKNIGTLIISLKN